MLRIIHCCLICENSLSTPATGKGIDSVPEKERALVLQGGGSLGAYEAGAYKAIYQVLSKEDDEKLVSHKRPTFDIVAGTSIGAINAAVLVSYVIENGSYEGSDERLIDFWNYLSKESIAEANPSFKPWWDYWHRINGTVATGEAARRYYSAKEFAICGVPNVFHPHLPAADQKFFDTYNTWYRYSNEPLKRSLERFAKFPIATRQEDNQPRLLLVTVDVAEGKPVVFDSYPNEDGSRRSEYGRYIRKEEKDIGFEYIIRYDDGITADHVIASGSYPVNFDYAKIEVETYVPMDIKHHNVGANVSSKNNVATNYKKEIRYFWDGGLMTNTPMTEVVMMHRRYWYQIRGLKNNIPSLGIAVINLHPTRQTEIPLDHDGVVNRNADITFSDRTHRDEEILLLISDYIDLVKKLITVAQENRIKQEIIDNILEKTTRFHGMFTRSLRYREIVEGRFSIDEVIRVERKTDEHAISNKIFDFSVRTIRRLLNDGYNDASYALQERNQKKI
jgi:predicted acylesterase/phospholipase RssA